MYVSLGYKGLYCAHLLHIQAYMNYYLTWLKLNATYQMCQTLFRETKVWCNSLVTCAMMVFFTVA